MSHKAQIVLDGVTKVFSGGVRAVDGVSLTIEAGEFIVLVGPSGCGKSTLLRLLAGLEDLTKGSISLGGRDLTEVGPRDRDIAMVFQNYALYPHMNVAENLGYGLRVRRTPKAEIERRVAEVAALLGLDELLARRPAALSGGQRQRVAMGRAIVREPAAYLLDEPLSNLDTQLRVGMRAELTRLHNRLGVTTVYVTHDQIEAMTLGDRAAVMRDGRVLQVGSPQALYRDPANLFVASFIGSPSMNLVRAELDGEFARFGGLLVSLDGARRPRGSSRGQVILGIRPEDFHDASLGSRALPTIDVTVAVVEDLGPEVLAFFPVDADRIAPSGLLADDRRALFCAKLDPATRARPGETLRLAVDPSRLHFFDAYDGESMLQLRALAA